MAVADLLWLWDPVQAAIMNEKVVAAGGAPVQGQQVGAGAAGGGQGQGQSREDEEGRGAGGVRIYNLPFVCQ